MKNKILIFCLSTLIILLVVGCASPSAASQPETMNTEVSTEKTAPTEEIVSIPATEVPASAPEINHTDIPIALSENRYGEAADFDSSKVITNESLVGGDRFTFGRFERPFNANAMDTYYPDIDIVNTAVFQDDTWIYGQLSIKELEFNSSKEAEYAVEIDTDLDGKADWLIVSSKPSGSDWTVGNVFIYTDADNDVGGTTPYLTDSPLPEGNGFETLVFDQGNGDDSDAAWVRISPEDPNTIEFSIKRSVLGAPSYFMLNMWAGYSLDPSTFEINDRYTHEEAGAADEGLEYFYPIKAVAEIDNSCRIPVGFQPTGSEAGLCATPQQIAGENEESSSSASGGRACPIAMIQVCDPLEGCWCEPVFVLPNPIITIP